MMSNAFEFVYPPSEKLPGGGTNLVTLLTFSLYEYFTNDKTNNLLSKVINLVAKFFTYLSKLLFPTTHQLVNIAPDFSDYTYRMIKAKRMPYRLRLNNARLDSKETLDDMMLRSIRKLCNLLGNFKSQRLVSIEESMLYFYVPLYLGLHDLINSNFISGFRIRHIYLAHIFSRLWGNVPGYLTYFPSYTRHVLQTLPRTYTVTHLSKINVKFVCFHF